MSRYEKLLKRLKAKPKDFTWSEATSLLQHFEFELLKGDGSRRKFYHKAKKVLITVHKPHPGNILKEYVIDLIITGLEDGGFL
ncbi:hypothetical protein GEOBRER4_n1262 [Citrifermentans bremense]|uniref:Type II toxin-antitoxin system HicA family toxin n=1 Tax=Citrifermentans bremense TaxID=60035 RepID=A0A6S6M3D5_9BACT|nr:hypothetical protein GEOBRER4_n1262 [Citrifermentans bremense]